MVGMKSSKVAVMSVIRSSEYVQHRRFSGRSQKEDGTTAAGRQRRAVSVLGIDAAEIEQIAADRVDGRARP
jgi:hypothetical protein